MQMATPPPSTGREPIVCIHFRYPSDESRSVEFRPSVYILLWERFPTSSPESVDCALSIGTASALCQVALVRSVTTLRCSFVVHSSSGQCMLPDRPVRCITHSPSAPP
ncbi:hypothetical protein KP509_20G037800 [Ceratopteris richardii]|uniref:Uncharacterized protein n=1 Tax=Ceratopteris richardii TaxID=49495 RepID=A0A8T2SF79_CERRI|nr:hypothetical protein KP509_20G037800 [Ceratopteris richardii]